MARKKDTPPAPGTPEGQPPKRGARVLNISIDEDALEILLTNRYEISFGSDTKAGSVRLVTGDTKGGLVILSKKRGASRAKPPKKDPDK